jgi:hypothetical protein
LRLFDTGLCLLRPSDGIYSSAAFMKLDHFDNEDVDLSDEDAGDFANLPDALERQYSDGLYNVHNYTKIVDIKLYKTFTHLSVSYLD